MHEKHLPNFFQSPNHFVDDGIVALLKGEEVKLLFVALRHTMGWESHRVQRQDRIGLSRFQEKTGLNRATVRRCLQNLCAYNILSQVEAGRIDGTTALWELNLGQHGEIYTDMLREREKAEQERNQTEKGSES